MNDARIFPVLNAAKKIADAFKTFMNHLLGEGFDTSFIKKILTNHRKLKNPIPI